MLDYWKCMFGWYHAHSSAMCEQKQTTNLIVAFLVEEDVVVEYFDKELDLHSAVHALIGDAQSFLQALQHTLPVTHLNTSITNVLCR